MGYIYFVRHGQTVWNVENKICGATDIALTELGHEQAMETGKKILEEEIRLKEQNFGKYESTPRNGEEFKEAKKQFLNRYGNGESMLHLAQRIYNLLDELATSDKTYILVAHNGIARMVHSYFHEMTNDEFAAYGVKNCAVVRYEFER